MPIFFQNCAWPAVALLFVLSLLVIPQVVEYQNNSTHDILQRNFEAKNITKDISLSKLISILNSHSYIYANWNATDSSEARSIKHFKHFLNILTPWIIAEPSTLLVQDNPSPYFNNINCSSSRFKHFLSGKRLNTPKVIVDFIPFGYDLDKLEVRLLENFESVDVFVIFESQMAQTGIEKPLIFDLVKDSQRFLRFRHKIIHLTATAEEMLRFAGRRRESTCNPDWDASLHVHVPDSKWSGWQNHNWELERAMRRLMVIKFKTLPPSHPDILLQREATRAITSRGFSLTFFGAKSSKRYTANNTHITDEAPLAIQSDADELLTGLALAHCALKSPRKFPLYAPCFSLKGNALTLQREGHTELFIEPEDSPDLLNYLFNAAPSINLLYETIMRNDTCRLTSPAQITPDNHMGLGAAVHLSSINEPAELWLKSLYTHHGRDNREYQTLVPQTLIDAGKRGEITPCIVRSSFGNTYHYPSANIDCDSVCNSVCRGVHYLSVVGGQDVYKALPWPLRLNPNRYPFIMANCTQHCVGSGW